MSKPKSVSRLLFVLATLLALMGLVAALAAQSAPPPTQTPAQLPEPDVSGPIEDVQLFYSVPPPADAQPAGVNATTIRFAHLAPFAPSINGTRVTVKLDGANVITNFGYGDKTAYQSVTTGTHQIQVLQGTTPIIDANVNLAAGAFSIIIVGDNNLVPRALWVVDDNEPPPAAGTATLRVAHAAVLGSTIDATRVDVCRQDGQPMNWASALGLRYVRVTDYRRNLTPMTYDLKITRHVSDDQPCAGEIVIDLPPIMLGPQVTTIYLVGDGTNRPLGYFLFDTSQQPPTPTPSPTPPPPGAFKSFIPSIRK